MSLLHPNEDDLAFDAANTQLGWNKAIRRCMRLRSLLEAARDRMHVDPTSEIAIEIDRALSQTFYDEQSIP